VFLITKCEQTSEDIVHDVFISLWIRKDRLSEIKDIHSYLYFMSRNFAIDHLRRKKVERQALKDWGYRQPKEFYNNSYFEKEFNQTMHDAIAFLPAQQKLIYQLKRECGLEKKRIAQHLNISPNTVKASMQNALKRIKKKLQVSGFR
jgi:RNA polymerase sigma-70 factor (ECF subfamily)